PVLVNMGDLVVAVVVRFQLETGKARLHCPFAAPAPASADARVRGVQLADHHADHVLQLFLVADITKKRLVDSSFFRPVHPVDIWAVKPMLHAPPGFIEDLPALGAVIHLDPGRELQAPRLTARSAPAGPRRRHLWRLARFGRARAGAAAKSERVNVVALSI